MWEGYYCLLSYGLSLRNPTQLSFIPKDVTIVSKENRAIRLSFVLHGLLFALLLLR